MKMPTLTRHFRLPPAHNASLQRDQGAWVLTAAAITLAPHLLTLPTWAAILCPLLLLWRGWRLWSGQMAPPRWLLIPLALGAAIGVRLSFGHLLGKDPGLSLLAVLLTLKLLEIRNQRDIRVTVMLCFFLQLGLFFNDQSLPVAAVALIATLFSLGSLLALVDPGGQTRERLANTALLILHGLPFMLALFLLFPRIDVPLWGLPADAFSATTGLSDSMMPGSISELSLSDALAFRAEFTGAVPTRANRYWRGPVLSLFDGRSWRLTLRPQQDLPVYQAQARGTQFNYQLMLEPHHQRWLPVLDFPAGPVANVRFAYDFQAHSRHTVSSRQTFSFTSYPAITVGENEQDWVLEQATHLPPQGNPRARVLASELKGTTAEETLQRTLTWLRQAGLRYTLQPPLMDFNSIDLFLFDDKLGFCEHFASAFVFLLRAGKVPARVVTGYQGGEINPYDGTMIVRQSDAHAWAEVWLEDRGWIRVDPTAFIAPQRIDGGLAQAVRGGDVLPVFLRPEFSWLRALRFRWDAFANEWNRLVLAYDQRKQRDLMEIFGLSNFDTSGMIGILGGALGVLMIVLFAWARRAHIAQAPLDRAWASLSRKLARYGLARALAEGPISYGQRLASALPAHAPTLTTLCAIYARLCYRPPASKADVRAFVQAIRTLDLKADDHPTSAESTSS
jgi:transglutaminase-like putative cysteine protease